MATAAAHVGDTASTPALRAQMDSDRHDAQVMGELSIKQWSLEGRRLSTGLRTCCAARGLSEASPGRQPDELCDGQVRLPHQRRLHAGGALPWVHRTMTVA